MRTLRRSASMAATLVAASAVLFAGAVVRAADPLYLQPPFDEITLDESNGSAVLRVKALDLPGRKLPSAANRAEDLEIELLDRPGEKFALPWMNVAGVKFFEQLVLAEAESLVKEGRFEEAQPQLAFLEAKYPQTAGLKEAVETFLWQQILLAFRAGQHEQSLALLVELYGRNRERQGLANAWQRVTIELVKADLAAKNYRAARGLLANLGERFPEFKETTVAPYEAQLQVQAQALLTTAQTAQAAGKRGEAHTAISEALEVWPDIAGGRELALSLHAQYPVVQVAVHQQAGSAAAGARVDGWAAVRVSRLLARPIVEPAPPGYRGGPYTPGEKSPQCVRYMRQSGDAAAAPSQPAEISERTYTDGAAALRALARGEVSVVDRLSPWDMDEFKAAPDVVVRSYAVPTVHVLVPNPNKPLTSHRVFRRAILYALDRETILRRGLLGGKELAGCQVLTGPLPQGEPSDPFAYGYDAKVELRPYEPFTAAVLARMAIDEVAGDGPSTGGKSPPLVLVHPASPVARGACQSIARQLSQIGLNVSVRELTIDQTAADYDLRYAELVIREPAVDVWRVLGPQGLVGTCSPAMLAALRGLDSAANKAEAAQKLHVIHRLAAAELPVIPLWQLTEHFAHHTSVQGLGEHPATLYQDVERWQLQPRIPAE